MRRALAVLAVAAVVLTGCAETDDSPTAEGTAPTSTPAGSPTTGESPSEETPTEDASASPDGGTGSSRGGDDSAAAAIEIEIKGDRIEPNGMRVKAQAGETITFDVESDRAAELHVHASPEQVLEVKKGESTLTLVIDRPGLVDVEEHHTGLVLVQLEVR